MKCCALLLSLLLCLGLTGCAPAEVEIPAMPVQAAEAAEAEESAAEELKETDKFAGAEKTAGAEQVLAGTGAGSTAEREPEPERASAGAGADVLLFGVTAPTLETADGTRFVSAELFADGGHLILQESEDAAVLCRMSACGSRRTGHRRSGRMGNSGSTASARRSDLGCSWGRQRTASSILRAPRTQICPRRMSMSPS